MENLQLDRHDGVAVIAPRRARLDAAAAPSFRKEALELIEQGERRLIVDLSAVEFVDSSGLGALVSILKALGARGEMAVYGARGSVVALFKLTRMDRVFDILPDRQAALARLNGPS
ncbi:STAS domain-containing protein [Ramlibacter sp. AN1015]|uniref:STAS domain-containing protein n=1 Tax=Ramlibacter sp. AN1015 TaxID=3133428 RepID=UPI0030BC64E6